MCARPLQICVELAVAKTLMSAASRLVSMPGGAQNGSGHSQQFKLNAIFLLSATRTVDMNYLYKPVEDGIAFLGFSVS